MAKKTIKSSRIVNGSQRTAGSEIKTEADITAEYRYVTEDLKRIGIIAAVLIGLLVVLSFLI